MQKFSGCHCFLKGKENYMDESSNLRMSQKTDSLINTTQIFKTDIKYSSKFQ